MEKEIVISKNLEEEIKLFQIDTSIFDKFESLKNSINLISCETIKEKIERYQKESDLLYSNNLHNNLEKVKILNREETLYFLEADTFTNKEHKKIVISESTIKNSTKNVNIQYLEECVYKNEKKDKKNIKNVILDISFDILSIFNQILRAFQINLKYSQYYISDVIQVDGKYTEVSVLDVSKDEKVEFNTDNPFIIKIPKNIDILVLNKFLGKMFLNFENDKSVIILYS